MKTVSKKLLSLGLALLLIFTSITAAFAADEQQYTYGAKHFLSTTNANNAGLILDKVDGLLKEQNIKMDIDLSVLGTFSIDFTSVSGACATIDRLKGIVRLANLDVTGAILGDLSDLNLNGWKEGMKRTGSDVTILNEVVELLSANSGIIGKFIEGKLDLGAVGDALDLDLNTMFGADGISGLIKGILVGVVYEEGTEEYNAAYAKKLDNFLYEDVINNMLAGGEDPALPGFSISGSTTFDGLFNELLCSLWNKVIIPAVTGISDKWIPQDAPEGIKKLAQVINFNGEEIVAAMSTPPSKDASFQSQINNLLGDFFAGLVPGFTGWTDGDVSKLSTNINALYAYLAKQLGLSEEDTALELSKFIAANIFAQGAEDYISGIASCKSMDEVAAVLLTNVANKSGIPVKASDNYETVLGDMLTYAVEKVVPLDYTAGAGKNVYTVLNDIVNVYLYDKGAAKALGMKSVAKDDIFTKIDELIAMTKIFDGLKGDYTSKTFITGVLDALLSFDLGELIDLTAVKFIGDFGSKSIAEILYKAVFNLLKSIMGKNILVAYKAPTPFDNAISNASLKSSVQNFLTALNSKKADILPVFLYLGALIIGDAPAASTKIEVSVPDQAYTGAQVTPLSAVLTVGSKTYSLLPHRDYDVSLLSNSFEIGDTASARLTLCGEIEGTVEVSYKIVLGTVDEISVTSSANLATLTWDAVPGAAKYEVYNGSTLLATVTEPVAALNGLTAATEYKLDVVCVSAAGVKSEKTSVSVVTAPEKVGTVKASSVTSSSVKLSWSAVKGATGYRVYSSTDNKSFKVLGTTTSTSYTAKKLSAKKAYYFKVEAYKKGAYTAYGQASAVVKVMTLIPTPSVKISSGTNTTVKISWAKVTGAAGYSVEKYVSGKWKVVKTTTATSYSDSKLKANTKYQYRVRAYYKSGSTNVYSAYSSTTAATTAAAKVTGVKVSSPTSSTLKVSWKKTTGATGYQVFYSTNKKSWKSVTTTNTSVTLKKLSANKKYYVRVRPLKKNGSVNFTGGYSSIVSGSTAVAKVSSLKVKSTTKNSVTLSWKKVSGATGYIIYRNGKKIATVKGASKTSYTNKSLSRSTTYKYQVCAYKTVSKKNINGDKSATVSARTKLF